MPGCICRICNRGLGCGHIPANHVNSRRCPPPPGNFTCDECGRSYASQKDVIHHKNRREHDEMACLSCRCWFKKPTHRTTHNKTFHRVDANPSVDMHTPTVSGRCRFKKRSRRTACNKTVHKVNVDAHPTVDLPTPTFLDSEDIDLEEYLKPYIFMDQEQTEIYKSCVDTVYGFLANNVTVSAVVKGGSLAKGTAIRGSSDIDLAAFMNDALGGKVGEWVYRQNLNKLIDTIEDALKKNESFMVRGVKRTKFSAKMEMKVPGGSEWIGVDILPAHNNLSSEYQTSGEATQKRLRYRVYDQMKRLEDHEREYFSSSLTQLQAEFVRKLPVYVKDVIRLMKHWKNVCLKSMERPGKSIPSSYPLELLTIHTWNKAGSPEGGRFDLKTAFKSVLKNLVNYRQVKAQWSDFYDTGDYPCPISTSGPLIRDPANPLRNVSSRFETWDEVAQKARDAMNSPLLRRVGTWN